MNPCWCCSSPRIAPSLYVICRYCSIRDRQSEVAEPRLRTFAGRLSPRPFQQPAILGLGGAWRTGGGHHDGTHGKLLTIGEPRLKRGRFAALQNARTSERRAD